MEVAFCYGGFQPDCRLRLECPLPFLVLAPSNLIHYDLNLVILPGFVLVKTEKSFNWHQINIPLCLTVTVALK